MVIEDESSLHQLQLLLRAAAEHRAQMRVHTTAPAHALPFLQVGRLVKVLNTPDASPGADSSHCHLYLNVLQWTCCICVHLSIGRSAWRVFCTQVLVARTMRSITASNCVCLDQHMVHTDTAIVLTGFGVRPWLHCLVPLHLPGIF